MAETAKPRPLRPGRLLSAWLPVLVWAAVIWQLGGDEWRQQETSRILGPLFEWLLPGLEPATRDGLVAAVRKLAHPGVYGLLAGLSLRAVELAGPRGPLPVAPTALLPVLVLALADEARQATLASRTGSVLDVGLDVAGGALMIGVVLALERRLGHRLFGGGGPGRV